LTYAVPLLIVLTVVVAFDVARPSATGTNNAGGAVPQPQASGSSPPPVVGEAPTGKVDVNLASADLPAGGDYTQAGAAGWRVVKGTTDPYGGGPKSFTYSVEVEDGVDAASFGGEDAFARMVDATLQDTRSWIAGGDLTWRRIDSGTPNVRISLTTPVTARFTNVCGYQIKYESSCYKPDNTGTDNHRVIINLARWVRGAVSYTGDIGAYRQYAINHEVGHFLGQSHVGCVKNGDLAPVMMQQSFGVTNDYVWQLNQADRLNKDAVAHDGKTCQYNPWPYPQGKAR
jgi:hypothetical protein